MSPLQKRNYRSFSPAFNKSTPNDRKRTVTVPIGTVTAAITRDIFRAASEVLIDQVTIISSVAVTSSPTNFFTFDVKLVSANVGSASVSLLAAVVSTANTPIVANSPYDLNPTVNTILGPNDVLQLLVTEGNAAPNLQDCLVVIDYEVTGFTTTTSTSTTTTTTTTTTTSTSTSSTTTVSTSSTTTIT